MKNNGSRSQPAKMLPHRSFQQPKQASFLGLPAELRDQIIGYCLPTEDTINVGEHFYLSERLTAYHIQLSRLRALKYRKHWESGTRHRYDPPVLSINRQVQEEASEILYRRTFIIEVNCGVYQDDKSADGTTTYDSKWRGTKLSARFPFHKVRQITIRLDTHPYCNQDHVFHHMVYTCGLLLRDAKRIQNLRVELRADDWHGIVLDPDCRSWKETSGTGFADRFNMAADYSWLDAQAGTLPADQIDKQVAFLLQPLALRGRVQSCEIVFCSEHRPSGKLRATMAYYHAVLSGDKGTGIPNWIRSEYEFIFFRREERARTRELTHQAWLRDTNEEYKCLHSGFGKKWTRKYSPKKPNCAGCDRSFDWITECWRCGMRACAMCKEDLKKKRPELEEARLAKEARRAKERERAEEARRAQEMEKIVEGSQG
ncbi:MAG: hypothetical protein LQ349_005616 [Xanthoria aureola]|nr:MAG: hypothetical protein LQ349_005616 [Xanthoria aureola]